MDDVLIIEVRNATPEGIPVEWMEIDLKRKVNQHVATVIVNTQEGIMPLPVQHCMN